MYEYLIAFRSVTRAQHAIAYLRQFHIVGKLERIPQGLATDGCGHGVIIRSVDFYPALSKLKQGQIAYERVFRMDLNFHAEEVVL